jgi:hypothetical protein
LGRSTKEKISFFLENNTHEQSKHILDRQSLRKTCRNTNTYTERMTDKKTDIQSKAGRLRLNDKQIERQSDKQRLNDKQIERQPDKQTAGIILTVRQMNRR